jgi:SAM-dependent methyltransferase
MADFHFVEDYERLVDTLCATYPLDEAMHLAVGGSFEVVGRTEVEILRNAGLSNGMHLVDLGCGSGRLASVLASGGVAIDYTGTDIVQRLLDYAASISPAHYVFKQHRELSVPVASDSADMICAFSLFTHLLHHETYLYLEDGYRALKKGGRFVFSFLEFALPQHWDIFVATVGTARNRTSVPLNCYIERIAIEKWAAAIGFEVVGFDPPDVTGGASALGQSVIVLQK